jgi:hypothetical protein
MRQQETNSQTKQLFTHGLTSSTRPTASSLMAFLSPPIVAIRHCHLARR